MIKGLGRRPALIPTVFLLILSVSCLSHLREAKHFYTRAQVLEREMRTEEAAAALKRARGEALEAAKNNPSSQAYLIKGLAETGLENWAEAETSFRAAFVLGFEKGEEWAEALALWGAAGALEELGLEDTAFRIYRILSRETKLRPVTLLAVQRYTELSLERAARLEGQDKAKGLRGLLSELERISGGDPACGYYHYAISQVCGHLEDVRRGFEEAVLAKELGVGGRRLSRDNDLQIIFCAGKLSETLRGEERDRFRELFLKWTVKWGWPDESTPDWKYAPDKGRLSEKRKERR
jgi:tetratricopeptide (TPR) repeat protein